MGNQEETGREDWASTRCSTDITSPVLGERTDCQDEGIGWSIEDQGKGKPITYSWIAWFK